MRKIVIAILAVGVISVRAEERPRPLMKDLMGLNVHTVNFKPGLYKPVTNILRNYHPVRWDLEKDTGTLPP